MKVLVTGGAGFIGSAFVRLAVRRGLGVSVVDKLTYAGDLQRVGEVFEKIQFHTMDITHEGALDAVFDKERPEVVVNFAAETHVDRSIINPHEFISSNVVGTATLLGLSRKHKIRKFVHISTDEVYGELPSDKGITFRETDPLMPNSPYSASKAGADMLVRAYHKTYGLPAVIIRPSNNYGPWQYPEKLIPLTVARVLLGEKIGVYGKGENVRTWLFVEDCAKAVLAVIEKGAVGEAYNVGSHEERENIDVVRTIISLLGKDESLIEFVPDRPGHDFRYAVDTAKIEAETGWKADHLFTNGLEKTVSWYAAHKEWLMKKKAEVEGFVKLLRADYEKRGA